MGDRIVHDNSPSATELTVGTIVDGEFLKRTGSAIVSAAGGGGGAPTDAEYIVGALHASLSAERLVTDTATLAWDLATAGQAKANVPDNAVTDAKLRDSAGVSVIGRATNSPGDPADIVASADDRVLVRAGGVLFFTQISTAMILDDAVTYAKLQNISATSRFLGRITAGAGNAEELTGTQATTLLDVFTSALKGLAPASGGGTTNFLRADGTWIAPGGSNPITRISGASGAAGSDITYQKLTADASVVGVTPTVVMTTTGLGVGVWHYRYVVIYQSSATGSGISFVVNHSGTLTEYAKTWHHITSGGTASTGVGDDIAATISGQIVEGHSNTANDADEGSTAGVVTADADVMAVIEGLLVVSASGQLELKIRSETAGVTARLKAGSLLVLEFIG